MYKAFDQWLLPYLLRAPFRPGRDRTTHLLLCVCDHFEPFHDANKEQAMERMRLWREQFPPAITPFQDADGIRPRHTFFYPIEQYDEEVLTALRELCAASGGEVEFQLHHDNDTEEGLRQALDQAKPRFQKHGFLSRDQSGQVRYGFVHGNWALDDSDPRGRNCGVRNELMILRETGCYADFTMPSAPHPTQTRIINSLYYATDTPRAKSHDTGVRVKVQPPDDRRKVATATLSPSDGERGAQPQIDVLADNPFPQFASREPNGDLLLVQGPLGLNWQRRKFGCLPRVENADLTEANPPVPDRIEAWLRAGIHVLGRPEWLFIKLHTHGALPANSRMLLGSAMQQFHRFLLEHYNDGRRYQVHYVTARELVNIVKAAEAGGEGNPGQFRDFIFLPPGTSQNS